MMRGFTAAAIVLAFLAVAGCASLIGLDKTTTISAVDEESEGGTRAGDGGATTEPDAGPPLLAEPDDDGGLSPDSGPPPSCLLGSPEAYVPDVPGVSVEVCDPAGAISAGGKFAGLDCKSGGLHVIDGFNVTACVAVDYGTPNLASATVRLFAVGKGCQNTCYNDGCTNDATARLFVGTTRNISTWQYRGTADLTSKAASYKITAPGGNFRVVGICRNANGPQYDDVAVDGVTPTCR